MNGPARVAAVAKSARHDFAKQACDSIRLIPGLGVEGDAHAGPTVRHLSRMRAEPKAPNLRQVHLIHQELFAEMADHGFMVRAGQLGENVTTREIDLLALARGTRLRLGVDAVIEVTGLRNPCRQIDRNIGAGAMAATLARAADGTLIRKAGVMAVVLAGGLVAAGDVIEPIHVPARALPLEPV